VYVRSASAETCPAEVDLRLWVMARLGYDPFSPQASRVVVARIDAQQGALHGNVELVDAQGLTSGQRSMTSRPERCAELARAMALSISLAIDPERASQPPALPAAAPRQEPAAAPPREPAASAAAPPTPPRDAPAARGAQQDGHFFAGAALASSSGALPGFGLGGLGYLGFRVSRLAVSLEGRGLESFVGRNVGQSGRLSGSLLGPGAALCGEALREFSGCLVAFVAAQRLTSSAVAEPKASTGLFVGLGPRLLWRKPLQAGLGLTLGLEGLVNLSRNTARLSNADVWTAWPVSAGGVLGLDTHFL